MDPQILSPFAINGRHMLAEKAGDVVELGVCIAGRTLNTLRGVAKDLAPAYVAPGFDEENVQVLMDDLIEFGRNVDTTELGVGDNVAEFFQSLCAYNAEDQEKRQELVNDLMLAEDHQFEDSSNALIKVIRNGKALCQKIVGKGNRIGILAENAYLTIKRNKLGAATYFKNCNGIGKYAESLADYEPYGKEIEKYSEDNSAKGKVPSVHGVATIAYTNGLKMLFETAVFKSESGFEEPDKELPRLVDESKEVVDEVHSLSAKCSDNSYLSTLCKVPSFYYFVAGKYLNKPQADEEIRRHLEAMEDRERKDLYSFIVNCESCQRLEAAASEELLRHYPDMVDNEFFGQ